MRGVIFGKYRYPLMKRVLIIGGGIVGQFIAYYLAKAGHEVTIVDDQPTMAPASAGNCGLITPSHILPVNSWKTLFQGLKWMGKKDAPLSIKPQFSLSFISWFASFIWHCQNRYVVNSVVSRHALLQESWQGYQDFFKEEAPDVNWSHTGMLYPCMTEQGLDSIRSEVGVLHKNGLAARMLSREEMLAMEPSIQPTIIGGAIYECDGSLKPYVLLESVREINTKLGVKRVRGEAIGFTTSGGKVTGLKLAGGDMEADEYIIAAGAKSVFLARLLGIPLNLIPGKGYNLTVQSTIENQPKFPIYMTEKRVVATPWKDAIRLGSTMEFTGFDLTLNPARLEALKRATEEFLQVDVKDMEFEPWAGWRPMTADGLPSIERTKKYKNLIMATGHGMLGMSMAPATGSRVASLVGPI
jgi:D-amino-acid dehydrogenase